VIEINALHCGGIHAYFYSNVPEKRVMVIDWVKKSASKVRST
jgi:hypothetical protein